MSYILTVRIRRNYPVFDLSLGHPDFLKSLANNFVANRIDDFQFYQLISQQMKCPSPNANGWLAQSHGNEFCLLLSIQLWGCWRVGSLLSFESCLESFRDELFTYILNRLHAAF